MDFRCPNCQKDLAVPDEFAGQLMKCPLCQNTFQAPALPSSSLLPPSQPASPPPPGPPAPVPSPTEQALPPLPPAPPLPVGDYTRTTTIWLSPRAVPWIAPVACLLVFFLLFFTWANIYTSPEPHPRGPWGLGFGGGNPLILFYLLLFLLAFLLVIGITALRFSPVPIKLPAAVKQVWPWRSAIVFFLLFLTFFFLILQICLGFNAADSAFVVTTTLWLWLAVLLHLTALIAALLDFWLEQRGPTRPLPRIQISW